MNLPSDRDYPVYLIKSDGTTTQTGWFKLKGQYANHIPVWIIPKHGVVIKYEDIPTNDPNYTPLEIANE